MITRDDVNVTYNHDGSITVAAVVNGYREKMRYFYDDETGLGYNSPANENDAVEDFLATYGEDAQ